MPTCVIVRENIKCGLFRGFLEFNAMLLIYTLQTNAFGSANKNYIVRLLGIWGIKMRSSATLGRILVLFRAHK